jgi:hypothetical protein
LITWQLLASQAEVCSMVLCLFSCTKLLQAITIERVSHFYTGPKQTEIKLVQQFSVYTTTAEVNV